MTTEATLDDETWSSVTEQTILLHDGLKYVADVVSPPEFLPKLLSFDLIDSGNIEFRFDPTWLAKLSETLRTTYSVEHSPYHLFFEFRQRSITTLWKLQKTFSHKSSNDQGNGESTLSLTGQNVSFTSHISLLLLLPLLQSQTRTDPSLPVSCIALLLNCLKECSPNSLNCEPASCIDGLKDLLCSWIETELVKLSPSLGNDASISMKEDIIAAFAALACGRMSLKTFIQLLFLLLKHRMSLLNISIGNVLHNSLKYLSTAKYTKPSLLRTSHFATQWPCYPFPDSPVPTCKVDEKCPSISSSGKYLFVSNGSEKGLAKIGSGKCGSFRGFVYNINLAMEDGWVAWNNDSLLFRPQSFDTDSKLFCLVLDPFSLQVKTTIELSESFEIPNMEENAKIMTVQFTSDGVHLYWIYTTTMQKRSQPNQQPSDFQLFVREFKLDIKQRNDDANMVPTYEAVSVRSAVTISIKNSKVKESPIHFTDTSTSLADCDLGLTHDRLLQTPMFVSSNMLVMVSPHSPPSCDPKIHVIRTKKNPLNCCFSLFDGQLIYKDSVIDSCDDNTWQSFFIPRLGICCDPDNGLLWTFGHGKMHEWINSGYPGLNPVMQQLAIADLDYSNTIDLLSPFQVISFVTIHISVLSKTLDAHLKASLPFITPLDDACLKLIYDVLHLAIVVKHQNTIVSLLQALQPFLKLAVTNNIKPDAQLVKDLRSLVWMLVCSSSSHNQIRVEACKAFVCGLRVFYSESKEQSALLMVLLSEKDSSGVLMLREMLLHQLALELNAVKSHNTSCKLAYDAVSRLIKTCVTESSRNIALCGSLDFEEFSKFSASQPDTSATLTYVSNLVLKTWKDLMLSEDCNVDGSLEEVSEFISKNVESIMLANKMFEACQKLFEDVFEVLSKLQVREKDFLALRLKGLEKVVKATPIGQVLVFLMTILTHSKFCSLPLASGLLSRVTSTTIAATKTAKLFCRLQASTILNVEESETSQSLMSSLPDLSIWTRSNRVESIHPIRDDYKFTKTVTFKGAKCLYIKFDPRCATQYEYDKVILYANTSPSGKKVGEYGGNSYGYGSKGVINLGWPEDIITVEGESVTLSFQVKSTRERNTPDRAVWGFACTISLKKDEEESDVTVPIFTDVALGLLYLNYKLLSVLYDGPLTIDEESTCKHLLDSQLLQRCVWEKSQATPLQESEACGITITVTPDKLTPPFPQPRQKLSQKLIKRLRNTSGIIAPTLRPSIQQALQPYDIEEVILSAVIRHLDMSDMTHGLELLQVTEFESSKYQRLCETMRGVFRRLDGILRQFQVMAEVELRWSQEVDDIRQGLLQPSAAFFNEYHLQEVKSKDLELLCNMKDIEFDPLEQEQVVGKLIELLDSDAKADTVKYDSEDLLSRMPKTRGKRQSLMECSEMLCSVTIKNDSKKDAPGRSMSQGTFSAMNLDNANLKSEDKTALFYRSLSAPSQLHRSLSVQEGAKDLRRLQRWRNVVQKKDKSLSVTSHPEGAVHSLDFGTIVDDIFTFIGSDRDKVISCNSFLTAARIRNERGLSRVQALLHMRDLVNTCCGMPGSLPNLLHTVASILSQGPRVDELKCGGLVETVRAEFNNVVQLLLQQASIDPLVYSNSIITLSVCPFSWREERCVIRSGVIALLDKLCILGSDNPKASHNLSTVAWASFQVLLDRFVQWEKDQDYRSGAIEWSGLAYQVSSLITNYLNAVLQQSTRNNLKTRDALQHVLKLLQSIARSKMGEAILQQSCTVSTLLTVLLDLHSPPKLVLAVLRLCHVALPLMTEASCQELKFPSNSESYLGEADLKPVIKVAKLLLMKLGEFVLPCSPLEINGNDNEEGKARADSEIQYSVYVHKRVNQPAHKVVQNIMSSLGQHVVSGSGIVEEIDRAVRFDQELTQNNQVLVLNDVLCVCQSRASQLAKMGLVTSIAPANQELGTSEDEKELKSSEEICHLRNRKLASESSCRPFVSGQVALAMASEVISLLQSLLSSCCSDSTTKLWSTAIKTVISDALILVPSLIDNMTNRVEHLMQYLLSENGDENLPAKQDDELMTSSRHVMAALCVLGGFQQTVYSGCKAKITGEVLELATCKVTSVNESQCIASVLLDSRDGKIQSSFDVPLARLELSDKQIVLVDKLDLIESTLEALHEILKTRDVTLPHPNTMHDGNVVLLQTSVARVLCEMKTRASMALACQMKAHAFCVVFNEHHSNPMQTIQTLANDCDPGQRLSILETHCQELRKLFKDLIKPSDGSLKGKLKDVALDITKDFPPVQGVVMSEGCKVAHLVSEGNNLQSVPRGSYVYSTISIPVKAPSFYWEVEVLSLGDTAEDTYVAGGSSLSIGLAPAVTHSPEKWFSPVGACLIHDNGIAVHYKRGGFTSWETINTGLVLIQGHVLGCGYTKSEDNGSTVYFTHNGQRLPGCLNDVKAGLWPVVHLQKKNVKVRVNFGNSPFKYAKGSKIRQAADLVTDSMEEIRNMLQELPFSQDSDDEIEREAPVTSQEPSSKAKNKPDPLKWIPSTDFREYDPSSSLTYLLSSTCDIMTDIGPSTQLKEDDRQAESLDYKTANPSDLLVKAWEEKVFPVIRRRFRNEADRRSGLEQIRGALQAGLMDIAIATLEDLYEDSGGIPNSLTMPRLEDVKEDVNKITISTIKQGMAVVISTSLLDASGYIVPDMKKTSCLNGIVLAIDKAQQLVEVETYNREEGHLTRFWYPVSVLERPSSGLSRSSSFLAMRTDENTHFETQQELLRCERELTLLKCREVLIEALRKPGLSPVSDGNNDLVLARTLSLHLLKAPYCNGSTTPVSLPTVPSPRRSLSLAKLLPSEIFYSKPLAITNEIHQLLDTSSLCGEDEMIKLTNNICQGLREPLICHREFFVSPDCLEEEVHFSDVAVTIVTCRLNPAVHSGWINSKNALVTVLCYYGGPILSKSSAKARYKAVQYPVVEPENQDKFPSKILPTNRLLVRNERHSMDGPIVDLHGLSADVLLGLVYIECFIDKLIDVLKTSEQEDTTKKSAYRAAVYTVIETASKFILKTALPPIVRETVFHLIAQLLRLNHKLEAKLGTPPSQAYTTQLTLIITRLAPLKTELQKLLDKEVSATNASALEFILKGNFENDKFTSYVQALFGVVLAMAEVTSLMRSRSGSRRQRQGSLTEALLQGELAEGQSEAVVSPLSFTFASFDFKSDSETPSSSPMTSPSPMVPHTPPGNTRPRRRGSLRKRKRAHVQEVVSPTESMPWFDAVVSVTLLLRNLLERDSRGISVVQESLCAVVNAKSSSVIQRLLVITNIPQTMTKQQVLDVFKKACKPSGGIFEEQTYIPEILASDTTKQQDEHSKGSWESLLPSAMASKPQRIRGHAVIEIRNSNQLDLARQAIAANKSLRESSTEHENMVGIAKVNADLLMAGTNELEAFAVFDEFLADKLYCKEELRPNVLGVLAEVYDSCSFALSQPELMKDQTQADVMSTLEGASRSKSPETTRSTDAIDENIKSTKTETIHEAFDDEGKREVQGLAHTINRSKSAELKQEITTQFLELQAYPEVIAKDLENSRLSPPPQGLTEEHICTPMTSNLLLVFFQTFCHAKQTVQDVVRQVIHEHGMEVGEDKASCLTVDGFIEWVKTKAVDNIRSVWKAAFACGYDLQFQRCTYIFPKDILEDHTNWSIAKDKVLVNFIDHKCRALSTSPSRLMPDELHVIQADLASQQYADLQNLSLLSIRSRFAFLKSVNQTIEHLLLPLADLRVTNTHSLSTGALLKMASGLMFHDTKMAFLNRTLDHSSQRSCPNSSPEISLDPLESLEADKVSSSSQFSQAARYLSSVTSAGLRVKVASGGDPTFPLRVQLRGEQVLGSGGSFRHFMWLMARELQSQHVNLLIPCPSTAANKNKGMLILKPGAMSYAEERLLVFFGQLLGIALRSDIPVAVDLMTVFWKSLLGLPLDPQTDLYETDILTYNYIRRFSEVESREEFSTLCYEADLCPYRFVYTSLNGQEVELCPDGDNKPVTWENHQEYVDLIRELRLKELGCMSRMAAVRCGLYSVIPIHELCVLQPSDLQKRTCGIPNVDLDFLKAHTTYVAGVRETDQHIEYFWNALESFTQDQLCKFVKFACNQERLPSICTCQKGTPSTADVHVPPYPMKIGPPDGTGRSDARYIRVETCMFMVKLPQYSTQEITNQKILYAINCREDPLTDI